MTSRKKKKGMSNKEATKLAEEILEAYGIALGESRAAFAEALMDETVPDPPFYVISKSIN